MMRRTAVIAIIVLILPVALQAQIRVGKLVVKPGETFSLGQSDILVADTLVMMDSSRIKLNTLKRENYIRARVLIVGNHCIIDGRGTKGQRGRDGVSGKTPPGPCQDGTPGRNGTRGLDGTPGVNLFLYLESIRINGRLIVDLSGGHGGDGGNGGLGGDGTQGTLHCIGGNGARGGDAGNGGNGAQGGTLSLECPEPNMKNWMGNRFTVYNHGGLPGQRGIAGYQGSGGIGPAGHNGKSGQTGNQAYNGLVGAKGEVNFEQKN